MGGAKLVQTGGETGGGETGPNRGGAKLVGGRNWSGGRNWRARLIPLALSNGQLLEPSAPRLALAYGEFKPFSALERSVPRLALAYGEFKPFSALERSNLFNSQLRAWR